MSWLIERSDGTFFLGSPIRDKVTRQDVEEIHLFGGETEAARYDDEARAFRWVNAIRNKFPEIEVQVVTR